MVPSSAPQLPERLTALRSARADLEPAALRPIDIVIRRWSSDHETRQLMTALEERGAEAMLEVLRELKPIGIIVTPGRLAYDLHYAQSTQTEKAGRHRPGNRSADLDLGADAAAAEYRVSLHVHRVAVG